MSRIWILQIILHHVLYPHHHHLQRHFLILIHQQSIKWKMWHTSPVSDIVSENEVINISSDGDTIPYAASPNAPDNPITIDDCFSIKSVTSGKIFSNTIQKNYNLSLKILLNNMGKRNHLVIVIIIRRIRIFSRNNTTHTVF